MMNKTLQQLGWSQERVAYAIGITRPTYKKYLTDKNGLTLEQSYKLKTLEELQITYKVFEREAMSQYIFERIWKQAYKELSESKFIEKLQS